MTEDKLNSIIVQLPLVLFILTLSNPRFLN